MSYIPACSQNETFDFSLPEHLIALRPARPRHSARLLVVHGCNGPLDHARVSDLPRLLNSGDALVINDSRVRRLAFAATRPARDGAAETVRISLLLHSQLDARRWRVLARPAKRLHVGDRLHIGNDLDCTVTDRDGHDVTVQFDTGTTVEIIESHGRMPLPPYISRRRAPDAFDDKDYQTRFARISGSIAAPTAGLHFTDTLVESLTAAGIVIHPITLHTGCATFAPTGAVNVASCAPPPETCAVSSHTARQINRVRASGGRCIAVGTTVLRALHAAWRDHQVQAFEGQTDLFVTPGFAFCATDALLTNFHLPRSSLFVLVCALMGIERMQQVYACAMRHDYRFYSYGDACLLLPER